MDIQKEIETLRRELNRYGKAYYEADAPLISDFAYDAMMRRLQELEAAHPEFMSPGSPTQLCCQKWNAPTMPTASTRKRSAPAGRR